MASGPSQDRREEFEEVALPHFNALFNLALNLTRNHAEAQDLVQEAFLRAFRFFDSYKPGTQIKAWLFRILRNTFINRYRARKARPEEVDFGKVESAYELLVEENFLRDRRPVSPEDAVLEGVLDEEIARAIRDLPEDYRSVVIMALVEEMAYKEIAEALSIPLGTVMSRLHRGRKRLQADLLEFARRRGILSTPKGVVPDEEPNS